MNPGDLFSGAAAYYDRYRPPYPDPLLQDLLHAAGGGARLVDWGCGTGRLTLPLGASFEEAVGVDTDADMIAVAACNADQLGRGNVRWVAGPAESLELPDASVDLIVAGSSFHWMDRALLARRAYRALTPAGAVGSTWTPNFRSRRSRATARWASPTAEAMSGA